MNRRPTTQDISWFLDLSAKGQLDLDPPYQRRSVWTPRDRRFFLDTILRNYPTGPIFLHKSIDEGGAQTFHVVDGKQRLETILMFARDELRAPVEFGDSTVDNKRFSDLSAAFKNAFWNYVLTVEMIDTTEGAIVNQVFDRLNRNSRKLTRQELRHARFDGAFSSHIEAEADSPFWTSVGLSTSARVRRMRDVEFIADLFILVMHGIVASDPDRLDQYFADYDDEIPDFEHHARRFAWTQAQLADLDQLYPLAKTRFTNYADFYALFAAVLATHPTGIDSARSRVALSKFVSEVEDPVSTSKKAQAYAHAVRGASSDAKERTVRIEILRSFVVPKK